MRARVTPATPAFAGAGSPATAGAPPRVFVSDHALLRYLERIVGVELPKGRRDDRNKLAAVSACGIRVEATRRRLARNASLVGAVASGASAVEICGVRFILRGSTVVTVTPPDWKHQSVFEEAITKAEYRRQTRRAGVPA